MAAVAIPRRERAIEARTTTDRPLLRDFLDRDRLFSAYAICDLEDREFARTRWGVAFAGGEVVAIGMEYSGVTPQPLFVAGRTDGIDAVLRDVLRPRAAYVAARVESMPAVEAHYRVDPGPQMVRMWVDHTTFQPFPADVSRLQPAESGELNRLYQLGFASWLPSLAVAEGVYYGIRVDGRLIAAAGTHVVSPRARLGVVGNVLTHVDYRGRGYATAVTSAVTEDLLQACDQVVLNVRADNPPALQAYRRLGFAEVVRFEERLVHRLGTPWSHIAAPLRRLLTFRKENRFQ